MANGRKRNCETRNNIPKGSLLPVIFLLALFLPSLSSLSVTWSPNLEWNTFSNWDDGFSPQNGTRVIFPVEMRLSVGLPAQNYPIDLAGLELPRDGALSLSRNGIITLKAERDLCRMEKYKSYRFDCAPWIYMAAASCSMAAELGFIPITISEAKASSKEAHWSLEGPLLWVDPNNWSSEKSSNAVPHLERIPCQDDLVVLPSSKRTFSIRLPDSPGTAVRAVKVEDDTGNLPPWEWRNLQMQSRREFSSGPMTVGYTGVQSCLDCPCQPDSVGRNLLTEVCRTRGASCGELECQYPLWIEGHCCYYCGGRIVLGDKTSLSLAKIAAHLALPNFDTSLSWWVRRTWDSKTEILLAGKKEYSTENIAKGIDALTSVLREQRIEISSIESTGAEVRFSKWTAVVGPFFGTLLMVVVLLLIAIPYFGHSLPMILGETWRGFRELVNTSGSGNAEVPAAGVRTASALLRRPFGFAKFENAPESEVELATSSSGIPIAHAARVENEDYDDEADVGGRFANPLYRSGRRPVPELQTFANLQRLHDDAEDEEIDLAIEP